MCIYALVHSNTTYVRAVNIQQLVDLFLGRVLENFGDLVSPHVFSFLALQFVLAVPFCTGLLVSRHSGQICL